MKNYKFWFFCIVAFGFWKLAFSTDIAKNMLKDAVAPNHQPEMASDAAVEEYARVAASSANSFYQTSLPNDGITKSERAYAQGKAVVYESVLAIRPGVTEAELDTWRAATRSEVVPGACSVLRKDEFFEKGFHFRYRYLERSGQVLDDFLVNRSACEAPKGAAQSPAGDNTKTFEIAELMAQGEQVYQANCAACHQADGMGLAGVFPAISGSKTVNGPIEGHIAIVLNGVPGTAMAAFAGMLSDADVAAVVTYQRNAWNNMMGDLAQPAEIAAARGGAATEAAAPAAQ